MLFEGNAKKLEGSVSELEHLYDFLSSDGEHTIYTCAWLPDGKPCGIVQISTGMGEYLGRYGEFADYLAGKGFLVVGMDHLGQGLTARNREEMGYFGKGHSDFLVKDMHTLRTQVQKEYGNVPYFMLGHSMGSYMLRKYLPQYGKGLSGALIIGTGFVPPWISRSGLLLGACLTLLKGDHYRSPYLAKLATGSGHYKQFCLDGSDPTRAWLTKDVEIVKSFYKSELCNYIYTLNGYKGLFEAVLFSNLEANNRSIDKDIPVLLASGTEDPVGDMGDGVKKVYEMMKRAGIRDLKMRLFEGDRHEILNETDRHETVYPEILQWLKAHL